MMRWIIFLLLLISLGKNVLGQNYEIYIENDQLINPNTFEFDVCIKSVSTPFELTSYQSVFTYYSKISNGGTLSFSYVPGTSDINNPPTFGIGINNSDGINKLTFASMPGNDVIDTVKKRIGRFRLENTTAFGLQISKIIGLQWNFSGIVSTILTGNNFTNITNPSNHTSRLQGLNKHIVNLSYASDTANSANHPGKTLDGLGYFDGNAQSFWRATPTPQWITFDLGAVKPVSLTRFSFQNFNSGRQYIYSIFLSTDDNIWTEVVSNDTSDLIEYTENIFESGMARFVKLLLISNNQNSSAAIWEAEIWDGEEVLPVELSSFNGRIENNMAFLEWVTSTELNNVGFEIERRAGNNEFLKIGFVPGAGTSTETHSYSFRDIDLTQGRYSYRLKQIDQDGSYTYSEIIELEILNVVNSFQLFQNYPNPFNPETSISFNLPADTKIKLSVFNILGEEIVELVNKELPSGYHKILFNSESIRGGLSSGIYIYRLEVENQFSDVRKMILMK